MPLLIRNEKKKKKKEIGWTIRYVGVRRESYFGVWVCLRAGVALFGCFSWLVG